MADNSAGDGGTIVGDALELRLAVVMTGGVSLAVWMGGVAAELYRAHRMDGVYGELLDALGVRVVVDVITGSSAGGLNGVLLAAALSRHIGVDDFMEAGELWESDGSIAALLRPVGEHDPPSLLRGDDYFLVRIRRQLDKWCRRPVVEGDKGLVLMVTATNLAGEPEAFLDDFGQRIDQVTHRARFTFRSEDLEDPNAAACLALAARTSASYPGAFEASFCPVGGLGPAGQPDMAAVASFGASRYAIDGGVLHNLPIGPAIDEVFRQPASGLTRRLLMYVNPDPGAPAERGDDDPDAVPELADVVGASLSGLPRHESVAEHLRAIRDHNSRVGAQRVGRRNALRLIESITEAASTQALFDDFRDRRASSSVSTTSARVAARAAGRLDAEVIAEAEAALVGKAKDAELWLPASFPAGPGLGTVDDPTSGPWPWGISPIEYAASVVTELIQQALTDHAAAVTEDIRVRLGELRSRLGDVLQKITPVRQLDDAFWQIRVGAFSGDAEVWAATSYRAWPILDPSALDADSRPNAFLADRYRARRAAVAASIHVNDAELTHQAVRAYLGKLANQVAAIAADTCRSLWSLLGGVQHPVLRALGLDAPASNLSDQSVVPVDGFEQEVPRRLLALFVVQVALGGAELPREQSVLLLQVSANVEHDLDPASAARSTAAGKLTGVGLHHFGAFLKRSWRTNDWMWGRLDGAQHMALALLDPRRLQQRMPTTEAAVELIERLATGSKRPGPGVDSELNRRFEADEADIRKELAFVDDMAAGRERAAPKGLPRCAKAIARRIEAEILAAELPRLAEAVRRSADEGYAVDAGAAAFLRELDAAKAHGGGLSVAQASTVLGKCQIGVESVGGELGGDVAASVVTQGAVVAASALAGTRSGIGFLRNPFRIVRALLLVVHALVRSAASAGATGATVTGAGLAASATVVGLAVSGVDIDGLWVAGAVTVLVVFTLLALVAAGTAAAVVPVLATALVVVAFTGDDLAGALTDQPRGWKASLLTGDTPQHAGQLLAGVLAVAMLVTIGAAWTSVAQRGWKSSATVARWVGVAFFGGAALYARVGLADDLRWLLVGGGDEGWKSTATEWLERAYDLRFLIVAIALPVAALLTEGIRRLPQAVRSALWLTRTTRLAPLRGDWAAGTVVAGVVALVLGPLLAWGDVGEQVRTVTGILAAAFVLFPRQCGALVGAPEDWALDGNPGRATAAGGRWGAALSMPVAILWAAGSLSDTRWSDASVTTTVLHAVVIIFGVACLEEVIFRGLLLRWCSSGLSTTAGVAISSVAFGLWHLAPEHERSGWGVVLVLVVIGTALAGMFLCWLRLRTRSLIAPTLVHAGVNLAVFLAVVTAV